MNLAQLIDPEWAQAGFPVRHPRLRPTMMATLESAKSPAPVKLPPKVGAFQIGLLEMLRKSAPMTQAALTKALCVNTEQVYVALKRLERRGIIKRIGTKGEFRYAIKEGA